MSSRPSTPPTVRLKLVGTAPFAKITLMKDDVEIPLSIGIEGRSGFDLDRS